MQLSVQFLLLLSSVTASLAARQHFELYDQVQSTYLNSKSELAVNSLRARDNEDALTIAQKHVEKIAPGTQYKLVPDHYTDDDTGVTHAYFVQTYNGVEIENTQINVNVKRDGTILSAGSSFLTGKIKAPKVVRRNQQLDAAEALRGVFEALNLPGNAANAEAVPVDSFSGAASDEFTISGVEGTLAEPTANLRYFQTPEGELKLIWRLETDFGDNWLITYADALKKGAVYGATDYVSEAQYQVYPLGINDPKDGNRAILTNPHKEAFSPGGWHKSGTTTYTTTQGNNGIAHENFDAGSDYINNYRPSGGSGQNYTFPYDVSMTDPKTYIDAAVAQLFYTSNMYHDLLESLGFTEQAGNFEEINTGTGGRGNDAVQLNAQDGSGFNNANFATPADGSRPRMRMYVWNSAAGGTIRRDGDFDNGIILHEYTHGLSNRLTGGPANSACLGSLEGGGMGEGWSDFYPTAIRLKPNDTRSTAYSMGDWANGVGIRPFPYSTSTTTNPSTYTYLNKSDYQAVHRIGSVWANMLYEVMWNLIDKHGMKTELFPDATVPTSGRTLAMKLVLEGMKLQPCRPTLLQARDAIIDADLLLTQGDNYCEIWKGFAKRGLGTNALQGTGTTGRRDGFDVPEECT